MRGSTTTLYVKSSMQDGNLKKDSPKTGTQITFSVMLCVRGQCGLYRAAVTIASYSLTLYFQDTTKPPLRIPPQHTHTHTHTHTQKQTHLSSMFYGGSLVAACSLHLLLPAHGEVFRQVVAAAVAAADVGNAVAIVVLMADIGTTAVVARAMVELLLEDSTVMAAMMMMMM